LYAASRVALDTTRQWLENKENRGKVGIELIALSSIAKVFIYATLYNNVYIQVDLVIFCVFLSKELSCYERLFPSYFPKAKEPEPVNDLPSSEAAPSAPEAPAAEETSTS